VPGEVEVVELQRLEERKRGETSRQVRVTHAEGEPAEEHDEKDEEEDHSTVDDGDEQMPSRGF
jgi:hypothetical protein